MPFKISEEQLIQIGYRIGIVLLILILTWLIAKIVKRLMMKRDHFVRIDSTQYKFLIHFITGAIYFMGIILVIYSIPSFKGLATAIFASSGVVAIIIGFASQQAFSNIVSGIFIALFKPFRINDKIRLVGKEFFGKVEDITLRHTVIRTYEHKRIIVPNSVISNEILENEHLTDSKIIKFWEIGISYDSDVEKAIKVIREEALKHSNYIDNRTLKDKEKGVEAIKIKVVGYGDFTVNLRAYIWTQDPQSAWELGCDLNRSVKKRFDQEGIEIPFPYRTLVYKNPKG